MKPIMVQISNFQSIEHLDLEIRGFTCVTGPTNIGKSAIIRAISSSLLNSSVVGMVRKGAAFTTVDVKADGWGYKWEKGDRGVNRYTINGEVRDKVGQAQLEEVASMGFFPVKVGTRKINPWHASQFFPVFLLDESELAVTDFISEVSKLQVMQDAVTLSSRGRKRALDEAKDKAVEATRLRERETKIRDLDGLEKIEAELEQQAASIGEYEERLIKAEAIHLSLEARRRSLSALEPATTIRVPIANLEANVERLKQANSWNEKLISSAHKILAIQGGSKAPVINVPVPPHEEKDQLAIIGKFAHIPALQERVWNLEPASAIDAPDVSGINNDMKALATAESMNLRISSSRAVVKKLSADLGVPDQSKREELKRELAGLKLLLKIVEAEASASQLEESASKMDEELLTIKSELAKIPCCPTCGSVGQRQVHAH